MSSIWPARLRHPRGAVNAGLGLLQKSGYRGSLGTPVCSRGQATPVNLHAATALLPRSGSRQLAGRQWFLRGAVRGTEKDVESLAPVGIIKPEDPRLAPSPLAFPYT